jgi:hypothetical protein
LGRDRVRVESGKKETGQTLKSESKEQVKVHSIEAGSAGLCAILRGGIFLFLLLSPIGVKAQTWTWHDEVVAPSAKQTSIAVDSQGNLHLTYLDDDEGVVKYAFRPLGSSRWFTMKLGGTHGNTETFTKVAVDSNDNPHVCYTPMILRYAYFDGKQWHDDQVAPNSGDISYSCGVAISADGTPHLIWYQYGNPDGSNYLHIKYAVLNDGMWLSRTIDFAAQTGKFESLTVDRRGSPHVSFDAYVDGELHYAEFQDGKWKTTTVDSRRTDKSGTYDLGMGNSVALSQDGNPMISYYTNSFVKFAKFDGSKWSTETIDSVNPTGSWLGWRSNLVLDQQGFPHISYEDGGLLKHAYWDGSQWRIQIIASSGPQRHRYHSMAVGTDGQLYVAYRAAVDGSLTLAIGRLGTASSSASAVGKTHP